MRNALFTDDEHICSLFDWGLTIFFVGATSTVSMIFHKVRGHFNSSVAVGVSSRSLLFEQNTGAISPSLSYLWWCASLS